EDHSQVTRDRPWSLSCTSREPDFIRDSQRGPVKSIEALISRNVEIKTPWLSSYFCGNETGGDLKFRNLLPLLFFPLFNLKYRIFFIEYRVFFIDLLEYRIFFINLLFIKYKLNS